MTIRIKYESGKELTKYVPDYAAANLIKRDLVSIWYGIDKVKRFNC